MPKELGKFKVVSSGNELTTMDIVERIVKNRYEYSKRNYEKEQKEIVNILKSEG